MTARLLTLFTLGLSLMLAPLAAADTVVLTNGDVLDVEVIEQNDNVVVIQHDVLGKVTLDRAQVKMVDLAEGATAAERAKIAEAEAFLKTKGYSVEAPAKDEPAEEPAKEPAEDAEPNPAKIAQAEAMLKGQGYTVEPPAAEEPPNPGLQIGGMSLLEGWERRFEVGITGAEGNTDNFKGRIALSGFYEDAETRWLIDTVYRYSADNDQTSENKYYAAATRDWLQPGRKHFYFLTGRYDWDEFQDWDHRLSGAGGIGYQFIKKEKLDLLGRAGVGGNQTWGGTDDEFTPEALLGVDVRWKPAKGQTVTFSNTYYPSLDDIEEYRNLTSFDWTIALEAAKNMSLKLGLENEYQSEPGGGAEKNDLTYYVTLVFDF